MKPSHIIASLSTGAFMMAVNSIAPELTVPLLGVLGGCTVIGAGVMRLPIIQNAMDELVKRFEIANTPKLLPPPPVQKQLPEPVEMHARIAAPVQMRQHTPPPVQSKPVSTVSITWHPDMQDAWRQRYVPHLDWQSIRPLQQDVSYVIRMIARGINATAVRVARDERYATDCVVVIAVFLIPHPLTESQKVHLRHHICHMQEIAYGSQHALVTVLGKKKEEQPHARMSRVDNMDSTNHPVHRPVVENGTTRSDTPPVIRPLQRYQHNHSVDAETETSHIASRANTPVNLRDDSPAITHELSKPVSLHELKPSERGMTIIVGASGDGKTQTSISMMVTDIARGYQVAWLNPDLSLYHAEDQPTDIRSLATHFECESEYPEIAKAIGAAVQIIIKRKPLYQEGKDVGHNIVLYIDEYPSIVAECGKGVAEDIARIAREGRKVRVWMVLATQDAQVSTLQFHGGVRNTFHTRLLGNVDVASWRAFGDGNPQRVDRGWWQCLGKVTGTNPIHLPPPEAIERISRMPPKRYMRLTALSQRTIEPVSADTFLERTDTPQCTDDSLVAWYYRQIRAGSTPSLRGAMNHFGMTYNAGTQVRMKEMFDRNGLEYEKRT